MDETPPFIPADTLRFFIQKGLKEGFSWLDIQREEHDRWFTVAKMMQRDLLADTYDVIKAGLEAGNAPEKTAKRLRELLAERGWWGKQVQTDPLTGARELVQLGSRRRVDTIVRNNMRTSYAAGRWARQQRTKEAFPYLRYVSVMDGNERPEHGGWHNTVLPADDDWWDTHYGPCDWGCRCKAVSLNARMMARLKLSVATTPPHFGTRTWTNKRTGEVREIEKGIGAGWDYHPGKSAADGLTAAPTSKPFTEESAARKSSGQDTARFALIDRAFGLTRANGYSAFWRDAGGWPVAVSRRMFRDADALTMARFARMLISPHEIRWVWLADEGGRTWLARRWLLGDMMLEIGAHGWRIGRARTEGRVVWQQGDQSKIDSPRDTR